MQDSSNDRNERDARSGHDRLDAIRGNDEAARDRAFVDLYRELVWWARRNLGSRSHEVDLDPESVAQSVLANHAEWAATSAVDDRHLWSRLRLAIEHEIIDRKRAIARRGQREIDAELARSDEPLHRAPSELPRSTLAEVIAQVARDGGRQRLLERVLVEGRSCAEAGRELAMSDEAVRAVLARARPALLRELIEPLRGFLTADEWRLCQELVASRRKISNVAELLGWSEQEVEARAGDAIVAGLVATYGDDVVAWLPRLMGWRKE